MSLLLLAGCSRFTRYDVYVTGYTGGPPSTIPPGSSIAGDPTFTWEPTTSTRRDPWLTLTAVPRAFGSDSIAAKPIWIGESKSSGANLPLRSMIDYLLVPAAATFGRKHLQTREVLRADDRAALRAP